MGTLKVSDRTLKKYFTFLNRLDDSSKNRLIDKLRKSIPASKKNVLSISELYGKWEDDLPAEKQIEEIRNSRIDRSSDLCFE